MKVFFDTNVLPLRDPDDAWVLASALAGGAELLVTGDKARLSVAELAPLPIVDPRGCQDRLRQAQCGADREVPHVVPTPGVLATRGGGATLA